MTMYQVLLHNISSLECQQVLTTHDYREAEDLLCDIKRVLSADMDVSIRKFNEEIIDWEDDTDPTFTLKY